VCLGGAYIKQQRGSRGEGEKPKRLPRVRNLVGKKKKEKKKGGSQLRSQPDRGKLKELVLIAKYWLRYKDGVRVRLCH